MYKIKKAVNTCIRCLAVCFGVLLIIHRRVIAAALTGIDMPEAPAWHSKCFGCKSR